MNESIQTGTRLAAAADPPFFSSSTAQPTAHGFEETPFGVWCIFFASLYPKNKIKKNPET
jgi:hypothetical protein